MKLKLLYEMRLKILIYLIFIAGLIYFSIFLCFFFVDKSKIEKIVVKNAKLLLPRRVFSEDLINKCDLLINQTTDNNDEQIKRTIEWTYKPLEDRKLLRNKGNGRICDELKTEYAFFNDPLSTEEKDFPLAYGILVHSVAEQVYYVFSAFYHPQNLYCFAIDDAATNDFKEDIALLGECFDNVIILSVPKVEWCDFGVLYGVHQCLQALSAAPHNWKYFQYLSGVDLPLKTNHEMVRIFKKLNGSINAEFTWYQEDRLDQKVDVATPFNITLFKSSLSATFNRETANFLAFDEQSLAVLDFLNGTVCPDESFWATMAGNIDKLRTPGGINGKRFIEDREKRPDTNITALRSYYISRFQEWVFSSNPVCYGDFASGSCVFGVGDVKRLLQVPHLVAHKFYLYLQPAAFFCLYYAIRQRALLDISKFDDKLYGDLPGPRITRLESVKEWFNIE